MSSFEEGLRQRLAATRRALAAAQRDGDHFGVQTHASEAEELERLGAAHGIVVTPEAADGPAVEDGTE
ncbi:hypothetical protein F5972_32465 [Microbispora cellulosiformans]|uniref:Uncharacterized protein n=1 Tax=Microbispora cellulosiformans TaxID=2614688 RepID=A0A5J5JVX0_9ACTN|nr:hypothetical protein [Microbispora cellulosiformans]KAA9374280.1 hypothetical protein F5972_32465 [Microbispora cellulosiformans]